MEDREDLFRYTAVGLIFAQNGALGAEMSILIALPTGR
jgi:hypothetical protein